MKLSAFLHLEQVKRKMLGADPKRLVKVVLPILEALFGESGDKIEADVVQPGFAQQRDCASSVAGCVSATERDKLAIDERLNTHACAIDPRRQPPFNLLAQERTRVDLDSHFAAGRNFEGFRATPSQQGELFGLDDRGSSAAEEYGIYLNSTAGFAFETLAPVSDFLSDGVDVASGQRFKEIGRVEIAIGAFALAKRNMDVDTGSPLHAKYAQPVDRDSAYERLTARLKKASPADAPDGGLGPAPAGRRTTTPRDQGAPRAPRAPKPEKSTAEKVIESTAFKQMARSIFGTARRR